MQPTPAPEHFKVPLLQSIAAAKNKTITIFDLETTTFLNQPTFGIAEVAAIHIHPDGRIEEVGSLVNPENPMSPGAAEVTGIDDSMLVNQSPWNEVGRDITHYWATHHIVLGFNCISFDFKAIEDQNKRYGQPNTVFKEGKDVRSYWRMISGSVKGKLTEVSAKYGINPDGAHRAIFDVRMTASLLEKFLEEKGVAFFDHPGGALNPGKPLDKLFLSVPPTAENPLGLVNREDHLIQMIEQSGYTSLARLSFQSGMSEFNLTSMLGDLMHEGRIDADKLADRDAQNFLLRSIPTVIDAAWSGENRGKLKPLMEAIAPYPKKVDYLQLRVFLREYGYFAAIDKARTTGELVLPKIATPEDEPDFSAQTYESTMVDASMR